MNPQILRNDRGDKICHSLSEIAPPGDSTIVVWSRTGEENLGWNARARERAREGRWKGIGGKGHAGRVTFEIQTKKIRLDYQNNLMCI